MRQAFNVWWIPNVENEMDQPGFQAADGRAGSRSVSEWASLQQDLIAGFLHLLHSEPAGNLRTRPTPRNLAGFLRQPGDQYWKRSIQKVGKNGLSGRAERQTMFMKRWGGKCQGEWRGSARVLPVVPSIQELSGIHSAYDLAAGEIKRF